MNVFSGDGDDAKAGREWLKSLLDERTVEVVFTKKDGTERVMNCTLKEDILPVVQKEMNEDSFTKEKSKDALAVWDVDVNGWRSFRWDAIKSVNFSLGEENA
jgi:hypothetical protein